MCLYSADSTLPRSLLAASQRDSSNLTSFYFTSFLETFVLLVSVLVAFAIIVLNPCVLAIFEAHCNEWLGFFYIFITGNNDF